MTHLSAPTLAGVAQPREADARLQIGTAVQIIFAVALAGLLLAAGFLAARSLASPASAQPATCSETCAPSPTAPPTRRRDVPSPSIKYHERSSR